MEGELETGSRYAVGAKSQLNSAAVRIGRGSAGIERNGSVDLVEGGLGVVGEIAIDAAIVMVAKPVRSRVPGILQELAGFMHGGFARHFQVGRGPQLVACKADLGGQMIWFS